VLAAGRIGETHSQTRAIASERAQHPHGEALSAAPSNDGVRSFSTKETVQQKYTPNEQVNKPNKAMETRSQA
jgi:hypothetical protein